MNVKGIAWPREDAWQATITEALTLYGWRWNHTRRSIARHQKDGTPI